MIKEAMRWPRALAKLDRSLIRLKLISSHGWRQIERILIVQAPPNPAALRAYMMDSALKSKEYLLPA